MNENRRRILEMLAEGKITADEADRLLGVVEQPSAESSRSYAPMERSVDVEVEEHEHRHVEHAHHAPTAVADPEDDERGNTREYSFEVGASPRLAVKSFNGRIEIKAGPDNEITVRARLRGANRVDYHAHQEGDAVIIEARRKEGLSLIPRPSGANITITAPAQTTIDLATSNGRVEVHGIEGSGPVHTSNGQIVLESVKGDHEVYTSNGRVDISDMEGSSEVRTSNGSIRLRNVKGAFKANTSNGSITFEGEIAEGSRNSFETSNGSVDVRLQGSPDLRIDARTSNGRVTSDLPLQSVSSQGRTHLVGTVGNGKGELVVRTTNGSVRIE